MHGESPPPGHIPEKSSGTTLKLLIKVWKGRYFNFSKYHLSDCNMRGEEGTSAGTQYNLINDNILLIR